MTISQQADELIEKYKPYASKEGVLFWRSQNAIRNATRCALESVNDRIGDFLKLTNTLPLMDSERAHIRNLYDIQKELESRIA